MIKDCEALRNYLIEDIKKQTDMVVVGCSGGADSTLVATMCMLALGKENVVAVHMPATKTDRDYFNLRSKNLANHLALPLQLNVPIWDIMDTLKTRINDSLDDLLRLSPIPDMSQMNEGNTRARARMTVLYAVCTAMSERYPDKRVRVVGTGNLSEDFIGYFTKYGDGAVDFSPLGTMYKSEVYQMLDYFKNTGVILEEHIDRVPSAGLWDGQSDQGELGFSYDEMEHSIRKWHADIPWDMNDKVDNFVAKRYKANKHKMMQPPIAQLGKFDTTYGEND